MDGAALYSHFRGDGGHLCVSHGSVHDPDSHGRARWVYCALPMLAIGAVAWLAIWMHIACL